METIHYKSLFLGSFKLFAEIFKKYFVVIVALASVDSSYSVGLYYIFQDKISYVYYIHIYNALFYPLFLLLLFGCIENHFKKRSAYDILSIISLFKRCYLRFVIYYVMINILALYGSMFLLYCLIFIKIPFVEAIIYFNNRSLFDAIKESYNRTQGKLLRYLMILLFFCIIGQILYVHFIQNNFLTYFDSGMIRNLYSKFIRALISLASNCYFVCLYYCLKKEKSYT